MEMFDEDGNGSVVEEECEMACANVRRERNGLTASMSDIDSAVAKLDSIFVSCYLIVCLVIVSALLSTKFATLAASFGSILLGLSWLIGATASEALSSIIFVFGNHVLDVGDHCQIEGLLSNASGSDATFIVHEIQLLSTVFKTTAGKYVQCSNAVLRQKVVVNLRRSGPIAEDFQIDVDYGVELAQIERLRGDMLEWIQSQKRDFLPGLDVQIVTLADQSKLRLQFDIRYKSNWQTQAVKNRRRNRESALTLSAHAPCR
jgi:small-conductance mechanosensitive channel